MRMRRAEADDVTEVLGLQLWAGRVPAPCCLDDSPGGWGGQTQEIDSVQHDGAFGVGVEDCWTSSRQAEVKRAAALLTSLPAPCRRAGCRQRKVGKETGRNTILVHRYLVTGSLTGQGSVSGGWQARHVTPT